LVPPDADNVNEAPAHNGPLLEAVATGTAFTVTVLLAVAVQPDALVTVTVYAPVMAVVAAGMLMLVPLLLNPPGPFHKYDVPPLALKLMVPPAHKLLTPLIPADGDVLTVTEVAATALQPEILVTVTV